MPHVILKVCPHHLTKYEDKGTSNIPILKLISKLGKIWKCSLGFIKISIFHLFYELGKILEVYTVLDQHFKIRILNLWMNWEKLCPYLSFTVENKIGNSHKKGWSHFKFTIND